MTSAALRPLSIGEILDLSFRLYRSHFTSLALIVVVCSGVPLLLSLYIEASGGYFVNGVLTVAYYLLFIVLGQIATAATLFLVSESYLGRSIDAGEALRRAVPYIGRLIVLALLFTLVVGVGFVLLIVPGIILACGLIFATPALVLESAPNALSALGRSWALSKGSKGKIFALLLTLVVLLYIPLFALTALGTVLLPASETGVSLVVLAMVGLVQVFIYPLFYCVLTVAYYDLRVRKEGFDLEVLASSLQPA